MAQLNDTIINGRLSVSDHIRIRAIQAPSSAGGTSYTLGNSNYGLVSNGTYVYWKYFGTAADKESLDRTAATTISSSGTSLVTERTVYYGLPYINNSHTYNSTNYIYAPITGGLAGQILVAKGNTTTPEWETPKIWHGTCSTDAATAIKEVVCANFPTGTNLTAGTVIFVKFDTTNSAAIGDLKLRVNSSAAGDEKPIKYLYNGDAPANIPAAAYLRGDQTYYFSYDGTNWVVRMHYNSNTTPYGVRIYHQTAAADWNYDDYPLIISRTRNSTFTALGNGSYSNNVYGIVFGDGTLTPTINPSTGVMKIPGGLNALTVIGATSLGNTLSVTGATTLSNTLAVTGTTTLSDTLSVTGATTLNDALSVVGAATLNNILTVTGEAQFNGNVLLNSTTTADTLTTGSLLVTGNSTLSNITNTSTLLPIVDNSYNIGASGNKYATIYATTLNGSLDGTITATNTAIANNDTLVFIDSSNSNKITASNITFDGSTTSKFLSQKGTWEQISITLNGSANSSPSFYAPIGAGSSGQFLKSDGSGAPLWSALPTANTTTAGIATLGASGGAATYGHTHTTSVTKVTSGTSSVTLEYSAMYKITAGGTDTIITMPGGSAITLNGSSTTSASFYAPTSSGTSGQYLKSGGANTAPSWQNFPTIPTITLNGSSTTSPSFYAPTSAGTSGQYLKSSGSGAPTWASISTSTTISTTTSQYYLVGHTSSSGSTSTLYCRTSTYVDSNGYLYATRVYNAVWNDYAEYRKTIEAYPGQVVFDNNDGSLSLSNRRLIPGCQIISDTYGSAMGETENSKTPVAVAGRVLAYTYQDRNNYHAGQAVCSAPNGTIDIMTREEIMMYPDAIIGIVSEIPDYETWGTDQIKINGRIWVKVR